MKTNMELFITSRNGNTLDPNLSISRRVIVRAYMYAKLVSSQLQK